MSPFLLPFHPHLHPVWNSTSRYYISLDCCALSQSDTLLVSALSRAQSSATGSHVVHVLCVVDSLARTARRYANKRALSADEGGNAASFMENLAAMVPLLYTGVLEPAVPEGKVGSVAVLTFYRISCLNDGTKYCRSICWPSMWSCCHRLRRRIVHAVDRHSRTLCRQHVALAPLTLNQSRSYDAPCDICTAHVKQTPISLAWFRVCLVEPCPDKCPMK